MENFLFELKIKELKLLNKKYKVIEDCLVLTEDKVLLKPEPTFDGYKIPKGNLINAIEKQSELTIPKEVAINCWFCPHCNRLFQELLPDFDHTGIENVSI
jgi:uncharacterized protein with PIN domain